MPEDAPSSSTAQKLAAAGAFLAVQVALFVSKAMLDADNERYRLENESIDQNEHPKHHSTTTATTSMFVDPSRNWDESVLYDFLVTDEKRCDFDVLYEMPVSLEQGGKYPKRPTVYRKVQKLGDDHQ